MCFSLAISEQAQVQMLFLLHSRFLIFLEDCFFCDDGNEVLHQCQTLELDTRVRKIANELGDTKIMALWTTLEEASKACEELKKRGCKVQCKENRCSCKKNGFKCTQIMFL